MGLGAALGSTILSFKKVTEAFLEERDDEREELASLGCEPWDIVMPCTLSMSVSMCVGLSKVLGVGDALSVKVKETR